MSWEKVKLGDISANIQTGPFGSQLHQYDYSETGTPVVMPKDLIGGKISEQSIARVSEDHVQRLNRHIIQKGDILYSRRGDVGRCAFATEHEKGWLCGTGCLRVTTDESIANSKFVFYQLQQPEVVGWVEKHAVGATMLNLNTTILSNIPLLLPSIETQRRIADILSAYDDLIENNQKQIRLLEEAAQRLYKEWFVDLRFPGHEQTQIIDGVPEGWEFQEIVAVLKKISRTKHILTKDYLPNGAIPVIDQSKEYISGYTNDVDSIVNMDNPVIVFGDHTRILKLIPFPFSCGADGTQILMSNDERVPQHLFYCALKQIDLSNYHYARHFKFLKRHKILIPSKPISIMFETIVSVFFKEIDILRNKIRKLRQTRESLLPKLINSDLDISSLEK